MEFLKESAKAVVAFVVAGVATWLAKKGLVLDADTQVALVSLLVGLVTAVAVWVTKNKPKTS